MALASIIEVYKLKHAMELNHLVVAAATLMLEIG